MTGVFWICLVGLTSAVNDVLMREAAVRLPSMEVAFFRVFFATLTLMPIILYYGVQTVYTKQINWHVLRAVLGFIAITGWCFGVSNVPLAIVSTVGHSIPLFVLALAFILLKERVIWQRVAATIAGFTGIVFIALNTTDTGGNTFHMLGMVGLLIAALSFALSDIVNKLMVHNESPLCMLFYFALGTSLAGAIPAYVVWVMPTYVELMYLVALGAGGNLILFFLLKAFAATDVSALAPFRYVELIFAVLFGLILYGEQPTQAILIGISVVLPSTLIAAILENRRAKSA